MFKIFHYANIPIKLKPNSKYPLDKFSQLKEGVLRKALVVPSNLIEGLPVDKSLLMLAHSREYVNGMESGSISDKQMREMGFPWSEALNERGSRIVGCTLGATQAALEDRISVVLGGGAHHARTDGGRGFCVFNDVAISVINLLNTSQASKIAVLDCDVHQGDGNAEILADYENVLTVSIHGEKNYPFRKVASDLDIGLADNSDDKDYLNALVRSMFYIEKQKPDFLFYIAGADPYHEDALGRLSISREGLAKRDQRVLSYAFENEIPIVVVFGGGYCNPISKTVEMNLQTIEVVSKIYFEFEEDTYSKLAAD